MAAGETPRAVVEEHLERVLASPGFARNERLSRFLRFIAQQELSGRGSELKESLIGVEVFGRKPGFDSKQDSTVRSEAARLRARLAEYYGDEGKNDTLVIELPKGGYTPLFRRPEAAGEGTAPVRSRFRTRLWLTIPLTCLALALAASGWWWVQHKSAPIPIAVLPLTNLSEDPANDYFADGLTGEIIRNLSIIDGLAVRSQTSSFAFKGKPRNVREAGKQLEADYILEGSVQRAGQHAPQRPRRHVGAEGVQVAVGQIHDPHHAVDEAQTTGDEKERRRGQERVEQMDEQEVHQSPSRWDSTFTSGFTRLPLRASVSTTR